MVLFIRRCGLKRFAPRLRRYNVDGALLMTFDPEDFLLLGKADSVNTKKVLLIRTSTVAAAMVHRHFSERFLVVFAEL